jgi:hypothetical protein
MLSTITRLMKPAKSSKVLPADVPGALPQEAKALAIVLREEFDTPFRFHDAATGGPVLVPGQEEATATSAAWERDAALELAAGDRPKVILVPGGRYLVGFPLAGLGLSSLVAVGIVPALAKTRAEAAQEQARLEKWSRSFHDRLVGAQGIRDCKRSRAEQDRQSMIAWEALMALDRLHRGTKIHKEPGRERRRVLRAAGELIGAQSLAWVPVQRNDDVVFEGERLLSHWDCGQLANALASQALWEESGYVLINDTRETSWAARFPQVLNLLAIPVADRKLTGWVLAFNKRRVPNKKIDVTSWVEST